MKKRWTPALVQELKRLRFEELWSLQMIGYAYGVSRERVRQVIGNTGFYATNKKRENNER